mmetsp:Transcript_33234/g.37168  ORF Transcript_33234/g.37168 Transcript_33234/m.37168 type:complete len:91 (+) Transcript_33234:385-657(+)
MTKGYGSLDDYILNTNIPGVIESGNSKSSVSSFVNMIPTPKRNNKSSGLPITDTIAKVLFQQQKRRRRRLGDLESNHCIKIVGKSSSQSS